MDLMLQKWIIQLWWRDERGNSFLHRACVSDADMRLIRYLTKKDSPKIRKSREERACLDALCELFLKAKAEGTLNEVQKRRAVLIDYLMNRQFDGDSLLKAALTS